MAANPLKALVPDRMPTEQDRNIVSLFSPERMFELIRYFILFDANVKKSAAISSSSPSEKS